jgi:hypothetical protein
VTFSLFNHVSAAQRAFIGSRMSTSPNLGDASPGSGDVKGAHDHSQVMSRGQS